MVESRSTLSRMANMYDTFGYIAHIYNIYIHKYIKCIYVINSMFWIYSKRPFFIGLNYVKTKLTDHTGWLLFSRGVGLCWVDIYRLSYIANLCILAKNSGQRGKSSFCILQTFIFHRLTTSIHIARQFILYIWMTNKVTQFVLWVLKKV